MRSKIDLMFKSELGKALFYEAEQTMINYGMSDMLAGGVLLGLSGGADSVFLLCFLLEYQKRNFDFPLLAVHINHSIRGEEADRDEAFCQSLCKELNVEFIAKKFDVPELAKKHGIGLEECARNIRYSEFHDIILSRNNVSAIAVAHNSNDNAETVIFNMLRGAGTRGLSGISPIRDNIVRPLIAIKKKDIVSLLESHGVKYVTDSTNLSDNYSRNYIRANIIPAFEKLNQTPEDMILRLSSNLRLDDEYISSVAEDFLNSHNPPRRAEMAGLHSAVLCRVLSLMAEKAGVSLSSAIISSLCDLIRRNDNFSYSIGGSKSFVCEYGVCSVSDISLSSFEYKIPLSIGKTEIDEFDADVYISHAPIDKSSLNVYKFSIQASLRSAIIDGTLYLRPKANGDTIFYGGITHKLKKIFNDKKIPPTLRSSIPILCDGNGVLWIPGVAVRNDGGSSDQGELFVALCIGKGHELSELRFRTAEEFKL